MRILASFLLIFLLWLGSVPARAAQSDMVDTGKVLAQMVSSRNAAAPGETFYVALRTEIDRDWHTYWQNPGDSGEPVQITWNLPSEIKAGQIVWPLPAPIPTGPIINYGFDGTPFFVVPLTVSADAAHGSVQKISADIYYLVCKDICIPEQTVLNFDLPIGASKIDERWDMAIKSALSSAPKEGSIRGGIVKNDSSVEISFTQLPDVDFSQSYFFPFEQGVVDHSAAQRAQSFDDGLIITAAPGYDWTEGKRPARADGLLRYKKDGVWTGELLAVSTGQSVVAAPIASGAPAAPSRADKRVSDIGLLGAIIGALIGGLILNLMPCVFPVISLKALKLAKTGPDDHSRIKREALAYLGGVVVSFLVLTALLLLTRTLSAETGWGFHLQSPIVISSLILLFFAIGLNLLGVFELSPRWTGAGQSLTEKGGLSGSFFTGVLAVIVATPCTAPFMAGAIGYALTQPALMVFVIFAALGLGFALPFLLIAFVPALRSRLPKPGMWMVRFRQFLAFPIFATVVWLIWVLLQQAGEDALVPIMLAILGLGFAIWLLSGRSKISKILGAVSLLAAMSVPVSLRYAGASVELSAGLSSEAWTAQRVTERRAEGRPVFVDFTAAWCVTCKVNEKLVLNTKAAQDLFARTNTAFLVADWTNKNEAIARELARHGRSGIPLYLLYPPGSDNREAEILPQILTQSMLEERINALLKAQP